MCSIIWSLLLLSSKAETLLWWEILQTRMCFTIMYKAQCQITRRGNKVCYCLNICIWHVNCVLNTVLPSSFWSMHSNTGDACSDFEEIIMNTDCIILFPSCIGHTVSMEMYLSHVKYKYVKEYISLNIYLYCILYIKHKNCMQL